MAEDKKLSWKDKVFLTELESGEKAELRFKCPRFTIGFNSRVGKVVIPSGDYHVNDLEAENEDHQKVIAYLAYIGGDTVETTVITKDIESEMNVEKPKKGGK